MEASTVSSYSRTLATSFDKAHEEELETAKYME